MENATDFSGQQLQVGDIVLRAYNISLEDYERMSLEQNHKCAICGNPEMNNKNKVLCVDHDHTTGKIRSLLCGSCNTGLGSFKDNK